eukprot:CAMPEP_0113936384 /NCGR_PEP_ID=MMETSP1339-20121228/3317_1 /TAXON_ID=94617 /ORGANISM="Fibrocapsa japonica" /LENGTH=58 /DNA_ID=CAMNT_0000938851 /DNA_START=29 /DNA_END=205 /DNA_ORIENTATION=- /assembly_acc=CAM_ASM_000762
MTVSKLRGLIRIRLNSSETIKSVPLKALLQAYASLFTLSSNQVAMTGLAYAQMQAGLE